MRVSPSWLLVLALLPWPSLSDAADVLPCRRDTAAGDRPRIGLVLGGGGARGFAHISVLRELERQRVPIDCVAGTSAGALVGGLYASGMSLDDIEKLVLSTNWPRLLDDSLDRPDRSYRRKRDDDFSLLPFKPGLDSKGVRLAPGLLAGENVQLLFDRLTQSVGRVENFDHLPIPYRAVATDANSGKAVVLDHGSLGLAMRISMSIPGVFTPVALDGRTLIDGGMADQVPVGVVRAMGADIVIAVDVGTPLTRLDEHASLLTFVDQLTGFLTVNNTLASLATLGPRDILIRPDFNGEVKTGDFGKAAQSIAIGAKAVAPFADRFAALTNPAAQLRLQTEGGARRDLVAPVIEFVRIENSSRYSDQLLLARLAVPIGKPLDAEVMDTRIQHLYGLQTLDKVTYRVAREHDQVGLVVNVVPHSYGPNYLETGLNLSSSFNGDFKLNVRAGVLRSPTGSRGGEARVLAQIGSEPGLLAELYQPIDLRGRYFVGARAGFQSPLLSQFDDNGQQVAVYEAPAWGVDLYGGREFGNYGAALLGWRRSRGHVTLVTGSPDLPESDFDIGEMRWSLTFDRLDSAYLPRNGSYANLVGVYSRESLGADANFDQINLDAVFAKLIGVHSGFVGFRYHATSNGEAPFQSQFRLGGVTRFAGYNSNELVTPNYMLGYAGYTFELGQVLQRPTILGGTLEYGATWGDAGTDSRRTELHGSVYLGFDSWLGRLLFGYGYGQGGRGTLFLQLGQTR